MPFQTISLSSSGVPGTSAAAALSWQCGKPTTVAVTMPSTTGGVDFTLQVSLQDVQQLGGSSLATWFNYGSSGIGTHYSSVNLDVGGAGPVISFLAPIAAVRLQSTTMSSGPLKAYILEGEIG